MKCSKCGTEIPAGARFCSGCGSPASREGYVTGQPVEKKKTGALAAIVGIGVVIIAALLLALLLKGPKVANVGPTQANQPPVLNGPQVPANNQPGVLQAPKTEAKQPEKKEVPQEVVDYLAHLKRVETMRQDTNDREVNELYAAAPNIIARMYEGIADPDATGHEPQQELSKKSNDYAKEWQGIASVFLSKPAPPQCGQLAEKYYNAFREAVKLMDAFQGALGNPEKPDMAKIQELGRVHTVVDKKLSEADQELGAVCKQFGLEKTFTIKSEAGTPSLLGQ